MFSDVVPPRAPRASASGERGGDHVVAELAYRRDGLVATKGRRRPATVSTAASPSAERASSPSPKRASAASARSQRLERLGLARRGARDDDLDRDRSSCPGSRARAPRSPASRRSGRGATTRRSSRCSCRAPAAASGASTPSRERGSARAGAARGGRSRPRSAPPGSPARASGGRRYGIRSAFTRSPSRPSSAGSSVSAATTETIPTRIAPTARLRMIEFGTSSIPNIATTKTVPLKSTARLAVAPEASIASSLLAAASRAPRGSERRRRASSRSRARGPSP